MQTKSIRDNLLYVFSNNINNKNNINLTNTNYYLEVTNLK
jgi:hypothetical protein